MKLDITRKRFTEWLRENPDLDFVRHDCELCPIAVFLGSGCDHDVNVDIGETIVDGEVFGTPRWAERFIKAFDGEATGPDTFRAKGADALKVLLALPAK